MINKLATGVGSMPRLLSVALVAFTAVFFWAYWPTLEILAHRWLRDSQYSHGVLVPPFALMLLGLRGCQLEKITFGFRWWGLPLLALGILLRLIGTYLYFDWLDAASILPCLAGFAVLLGGKQALHWAWPSIAFLVFMIPLPYRFELAAAGPLRRLATLLSTYALQTIGFPAIAEGNVILLGEVKIGVVEACSGLSMLVTFFALATGVTFVIQRVWWEKLVLVLSAVPIAVIVNVIRITVTGTLHETVGHEVANLVFHDLAGWMMMPLALALLWVELKVLSRLMCTPVSGAIGPPKAQGQPDRVGPGAGPKKRKRRLKGNEKAGIYPLPPNTKAKR
jgi:exosortase